jgi:hypothetical protein
MCKATIGWISWGVTQGRLPQSPTWMRKPAIERGGRGIGFAEGDVNHAREAG